MLLHDPIASVPIHMQVVARNEMNPTIGTHSALAYSWALGVAERSAGGAHKLAGAQAQERV